jgi:hypothetical protein
LEKGKNKSAFTCNSKGTYGLHSHTDDDFLKTVHVEMGTNVQFKAHTNSVSPNAPISLNIVKTIKLMWTMLKWFSGTGKTLEEQKVDGEKIAVDMLESSNLEIG